MIGERVRLQLGSTFVAARAADYPVQARSFRVRRGRARRGWLFDAGMFDHRMSATPNRRLRQPQRLPSGRHGLPRSFVVSNQRERILDAVADVASLAGYAAMTVEDIVATAGVSRRTFYDNFRDKEEAYLAAYDAAVAQVIGLMQEAIAQNDTFPGRVRDCLAAGLEFVANEPRFADMCIVEAPAAGTQAIKRRNDAIGAVTALLHAAPEDSTNGPRPPALVAEMIVGGVYEVVYARVLQGQTDELANLQHDLAYSVMLPYIGHDAAKREAAKPPSSREQNRSSLKAASDSRQT